jgi:hypothetical protein
VKRGDETRVRASLLEAMTHWWDGSDGLEATNVQRPIIGDATLVLMAEAAMGVLLAIDDVETYLRETGSMVQEED